MRWVLAALTAVLLAGCGGAPAKPDTTEPEGFEEFVIPEGTLAIRGVVVNEAIVPLAGATVDLDNGTSTVTNDQGAFAFIDVEKGVYVLNAHKPGFTTVSTSVTVAGPDDPIFRLQLVSDPGTKPWHQTTSVRGLLQCGVGLPAATSYSACQTPNGAVDIACDSSGGAVCLDHPMEHRGIIEVDVPDGIPAYGQAEAVWEPTNPSSQELLWNSYARERGTLDFDDAKGYQGPSPLIMPWNETRLQENEIGNGHIFVFQVFPATGGTGNVVLQQQVELFVTTFYHYLPPEGWAFANDGPPVDPT